MMACMYSYISSNLCYLLILISTDKQPTTSQVSGASSCDGACIGAIIGAILGAILVAGIVAAVIVGVYFALHNPAVATSAVPGSGINGYVP